MIGTAEEGVLLALSGCRPGVLVRALRRTGQPCTIQDDPAPKASSAEAGTRRRKGV